MVPSAQFALLFLGDINVEQTCVESSCGGEHHRAVRVLLLRVARSVCRRPHECSEVETATYV